MTACVCASSLLASSYTQHPAPSVAHGPAELQLLQLAPEKDAFMCNPKACPTTTTDPDKGNLVGAQIAQFGWVMDFCQGGASVDFSGTPDSFQVAPKLPYKSVRRNVDNYGTAIVSLAQHGHDHAAVDLFEEIFELGMKPDPQACVCMLKACSAIGALREGERLHGHIIGSGLESNLFVGSCLIDMYSKCRKSHDASIVFERLPNRNPVTWNTLITGYAQLGKSHDALALYEQMRLENVTPSKITFISVLRACSGAGALENARHVHVSMVESGFELDLHAGSALVHMYAECGCFQEAQSLFERLPLKNIVTWSALIEGYARHGLHEKAFLLFKEMKQMGLNPNYVTFSCIMKACSSTEFLDQGRQVHADIVGCGSESNVFVRNNLIDMYGRCESLQDAHSVFKRFPDRNVVTWSTLIGGYAQHGLGQEAFQIFEEMQNEGLEPNKVTFVCILKACSNTAFLEQGRKVHAFILESDLESDLIIGNALVNLYIQSGRLKDACSVFTSSQNQNLVTWSTLLAGYSQHGYEQEAVDLFWQIQECGIKPDNIICACILKACANMSALGQGMQIHACLVETGLERDAHAGSALISMYAKCGSLKDAYRVFERQFKKDVITWTALIEGCAYHCELTLALHHFKGMQMAGIKPDSITFLCLLSACSHVGAVGESCCHFSSMRAVHGIIPSLDHFNSLVDVLGHANHMKEAEDLLEMIPFEGNAVGWMSLLSSCQAQGNVDLGRRCFNQVVKVERENSSGYVLMACIYTSAGMDEDAEKLEQARIHANAWKKPGKAFVEIDNQIHVFTVGDNIHPRSSDILAKLNTLEIQMANEGYHLCSFSP